ncbi:pepsin/retropepsin-like aspartic protease family protein [Neptunitalea lumnitzerae]|uniref:Aspartyl protease n=1 Tax=Neptunitalea lumnitzerae TaxID=2965509 RepID=A0ABQ5MF12_9FLAO|nr:retroviral-like aspartic protease family protein [Neptunitalea sp. Y10]GLB47991.1 hypothetical protein Y10_03590 [Neptunitalea sp. Y10]
MIQSNNMMYRIFFSLLLLLVTHSLSAQQITLPDTIPLTLNQQNTMYVKAVFNHKDTLNLNFDTGTTELILTTETLEHKLSTPPALYNTFYNVKIGNTTYRSKVYDAALSGHDTDGRFGWDFFKNKVVELNYNTNILVVSPSIPKYVQEDNSYTTLNMMPFKDLLMIKGTIAQNNIKVKDSFLFDTGYQRTAMLDREVMDTKDFPYQEMETIKKVIMKGAQGNQIPVITANLQSLTLGDYELNNVPIQLLTANKPMKGVAIHILGNEVLKRFHLFLDFKNYLVYLKPNKLFEAPYADQKS